MLKCAMPRYAQESLEHLRERIDLVDVIGAHVHLHRSGAAFKARCPFHEEKTPSFMIQKGDKHYHCFGCGAHGDAIAFLMTHVKMGFTEAVESLAERFQVVLKPATEEEGPVGPSKTLLKQALEHASKFYHFFLLHTAPGHVALRYLYERGLDLTFIRKFEIGLAPAAGDLLTRYLQAQGLSEAVLELSGLLAANRRHKDFFVDRITFPIRDGMGAVIGFSARKYKEATFGGKYINTSETVLFKKSNVLFGLSYSRSRIVKEKKAIIVEGQVDALQWIHAGFDYTVAGQGTAFGDGHVRELLHLGVQQVILAMDGDGAGREATVKIGDLFQSKGVDVRIARLPDGKDPDSVLKDRGPAYIQHMLDESCDYLRFVFDYWAKSCQLNSPSQKSEMVQRLATMIRSWEQPVMVHESLRRLADMAQVPETLLNIGTPLLDAIVVKKSETTSPAIVDRNRILEADLLRWIVMLGKKEPKVIKLIKKNIQSHHLYVGAAKNLYARCILADEQGESIDLLELGEVLRDEDELQFLSEILQRKINPQRGEEGVVETIHQLLIRSWMDERERLLEKIRAGGDEEEVLQLVKQFDALKQRPPTVLHCH